MAGSNCHLSSSRPRGPAIGGRRWVAQGRTGARSPLCICFPHHLVYHYEMSSASTSSSSSSSSSMPPNSSAVLTAHSRWDSRSTTAPSALASSGFVDPFAALCPARVWRKESTRPYKPGLHLRCASQLLCVRPTGRGSEAQRHRRRGGPAHQPRLPGRHDQQRLQRRARHVGRRRRLVHLDPPARRQRAQQQPCSSMRRLRSCLLALHCQASPGPLAAKHVHCTFQQACSLGMHCGRRSETLTQDMWLRQGDANVCAALSIQHSSHLRQHMRACTHAG
jgi:hypothetical protein